MRASPANNPYTQTVVLLLVLFSLPTSAYGQGQSQVTLAIRAGLDGQCKENHWIPLRIMLENQGEQLDGRVEVRPQNFTGESTVFARQISLPEGSRKEIILNVYLQGYHSELPVTLVSGETVIASEALPVNCVRPQDRLFGVLSSNPSAFNFLTELNPPDGKAAIAHLEPSDLPDQAPALQAVDVLIISAIDSGRLSERQREALTIWLYGGGQMVVTGGPGWQKTSAGLDHLLPLLPESAQSLSGLEALGKFAGSRSGLSGPATVALGSLAGSAEIVVDQAGVPLVIQKTYGSGQVFYLAADPALAPLKDWGSRVLFFNKLLSNPAQPPTWHTGFQDWDSAAHAVSTIAGLELPSPGLIIGFLALYIAVIGPLNYIMLRGLKRRELAWFSIPALVIFFSGLAFLTSSQVRGNRPVLNRLSIVQVWPDVELAKVDALLGVFSPRRSTFQLEIEPKILARPVPANPVLARRDGWLFHQGEQGETYIPDLHIDVGGLNAVALEGQVLAPTFKQNLTLRLDSRDAVLEGSVKNQSDLLLKDAVLLVTGKAQRLGDFAPDETRQIHLSLQTSGRALPGETTAAGLPLPPSTNYGGQAVDNDPLLVNLLGTQDLSGDPERYRQAALLSATLGKQSGYSVSGSSFYLVGWSDSSPVSSTLNGHRFNHINTSLYLIALAPEISSETGRLQLPAGLFTWRILESSLAGSASPYDLYLEQGSLSLRFNPAYPIPFRSVESLSLRLESYGANGPTGFMIHLWDFTSGNWELLPVTNWGEHEIQEPGRFVGASGEIRLQLDNTGGSRPASIEAVDFSLVVER